MAENRVMAVGFVLTHQQGDMGPLHLRVWTRLSESQTPQVEDYHTLTYLEAMEVINVHCDCNRPGWAVGDGWQQLPLLG